MDAGSSYWSGLIKEAMQSASWISLLKLIPPAQQNSLLLVTSAGTQITIQNIFRLEPDYAVIRGRLAGTTETGRVFFIPYDQINHIGFQTEVKEAVIRQLYGEPEPEPSPQVASVESSSPLPAEPEVVAPATPTPSPSKPSEPVVTPMTLKPEPRIAIPRRSGILARLRARSDAAKEQGASPKP
jgi:hypothetical protein